MAKYDHLNGQACVPDSLIANVFGKLEVMRGFTSHAKFFSGNISACCLDAPFQSATDCRV